MFKNSYHFFSFLLILSLLLPSIQAPSASAREDQCGPGETDTGHGCETEEQRKQREAEEREQKVKSLSSSLGVSVSTSPVSTYDNPSVPEGAVSVNGITMDISEAESAIKAMGASYSHLDKSNVDTDTTLKVYANGTAQPGDVVGKVSGAVGDPQTVAKKEIQSTVGATAAGAASNQATYLGNDLGEGVSFDELLKDIPGLTGTPETVDVSTAAETSDEVFYSADVFFDSTPISGTLGGDSQLGPGTANTFTEISATQKQLLGEPVTGDDWTDKELKAQASAILASENAVIAGKIGRGEPLTPEEQAEATAIMGVAINRAAAKGLSVTSYFNDDIYSNWSTESQKRISELEGDPEYDHAKVGDFYENLFTGQTQTQSFHSTDLQEASPIGDATHYYNPKAAEVHNQGQYALEGSQTQLGEHIFSQQYYADRSGVEYSIKTSGLPEYITVVDTTLASIEDVEDITGSGDLYDDSPTIDTSGAKKTRTIFDYINYKKEEVKELTVPEDNPSVTGGAINYVYTDGTTRNEEITTELQAQLQYAGQKTGLDIHVYSGGQMSKEEAIRLGAVKKKNTWYLNGKPIRVGGVRHDHGGAADIYLTDQQGKVLDMTVAADREKMKDFLTEAVAAGANGIGAAVDYMGANGIHVGGGSEVAWGAGGRSANAPEWVQSALNEGLKKRKDFDGTLTPVTPTHTDHDDHIDEQNKAAAKDLGKSVGKGVGNAVCGPICGDAGEEIGGTLVDLILNNIGSGSSSNNTNSNNSGSDDDDNGNSNNSQPSETTCIPCPFETGCEDLVHLNYCPVYQGDNYLPSAVIIGFNNAYDSLSGVLDQVDSILQYLTKDTESTDTSEETAEIVTIPVTVTINASTAEVELSRQDIVSGFKNNIEDYSYGELLRIIGQFEETPLAFDSQGKLVYSNGLYAPLMENGNKIDTGNIKYNYVYTAVFIDENGDPIDIEENSETLPNNLIGNILQAAINSDEIFVKNQVASIGYLIVDPNKNITGDEYYDYSIELKDGNSRAVTVPKFTSVNFMQERFESIGYRGEVLDLITQATEREESQMGAIGKFLGYVQNLTKGTLSQVFSTPENEEPATLPDLGGKKDLDILSLTLHTNTNMECRNGESGFVYSALISDPDDPSKGYYISDGRCGEGNASSMVKESIRHLSDKYRASDDVSEDVINNIIFNSQSTEYSPKVSKIQLRDTEKTQPETPTPEPTTPTETQPTTSDSLPNLTNNITFEVKIIGGDGSMLADWTEADTINLSGNVELYFRWDGTAYQQCLPFLQDNGNYSLTRINSAMTSGDTEAEGYNVPERSGTYRIECGGQKNNELGVDAKEIEVNIQ